MGRWVQARELGLVREPAWESVQLQVPTPASLPFPAPLQARLPASP
jgi:hypothetical protein